LRSDFRSLVLVNRGLTFAPPDNAFNQNRERPGLYKHRTGGTVLTSRTGPQYEASVKITNPSQLPSHGPLPKCTMQLGRAV